MCAVAITVISGFLAGEAARQCRVDVQVEVIEINSAVDRESATYARVSARSYARGALRHALRRFRCRAAFGLDDAHRLLLFATDDIGIVRPNARDRLRRRRNREAAD